MATEHEAWLKLTIEEPIEPQLPICDPHHHLWDYPDRPNPRYLLDELLQDTGGGHNIIQTVFVECHSMYREYGPEEMKPVGETEFVESIAAQSAGGLYGKTAVAAGIVGFADLTLGSAVAPVLEAHIAASPNRFRGIRQSSPWDPTGAVISPFFHPKGLLLEPKFREGFKYLSKYGLSFDAWLYHPQLTELLDLVRAFPDTPIILDHIGGFLGVGPYAVKHEEVFRQWQSDIAELATCPNVVVKLGGLGMTQCGFGWHEQPKPPNSTELAEAMAPFYNWCIESFGANRCMFESNFPVDRMSYSYTVLWNAFKRVCKDLSPEDKVSLFHDTAARVYRLPTSHQV